MSVCRVCLAPTAADRPYHSQCLKRLFGQSQCPRVDLGSTSLNKAIATQAEQISISGVQDKLIVDLTESGEAVAPAEHGRYILKVQTQSFRHLPQNEHLTMTLAEMVGILVPTSGLLELPGGGLAYIVKRFDRTDDLPPAKRRQEDFCSLLMFDPNLKYAASAEDCAAVVRKYSATVDVDLRRLFQQFLFAFWVGNDDLHLKNLSLSQYATGGYTLSPAYDLVCTRLYQLSKGMALTLKGRKFGHNRSHFVAFATDCGIDASDAHTEIDRLHSQVTNAIKTIDRSVLPEPFRRVYRRELQKKQAALAGRTT